MERLSRAAMASRLRRVPGPLPPSTRLACIGTMKTRRGTMPSIAIRTARPISSIGALTAAVTTHASTSGFLHKGNQGLLAYKAGSLLYCGVFARTAALGPQAFAAITALPLTIMGLRAVLWMLARVSFILRVRTSLQVCARARLRSVGRGRSVGA